MLIQLRNCFSIIMRVKPQLNRVIFRHFINIKLFLKYRKKLQCTVQDKPKTGLLFLRYVTLKVLARSAASGQKCYFILTPASEY